MKRRKSNLVLDVRHMTSMFRKLLAHDPARFARVFHLAASYVDVYERPDAETSTEVEARALWHKTRGIA